MSKPISFGLSSKPKTVSSTATPSTSKPGTPKPISFFAHSANIRKPLSVGQSKSKSSALRDDSEEEDEGQPKHEELTGFSATGAILSKPKNEQTERIIENAGNGDWRKRGKNLLPAEVQAAQKGQDVVVVERDEVSKTYGLQFAKKEQSTESTTATKDGDTDMNNGVDAPQEPPKAMTEDERALAALLDDGTGKPKSTATIAVQANDAWQRSEADDFRADVSARPDSSTLDEYAAMPVEEFGIAMLRGMGRKRRANGEIIDLNKGAEDEKKRKERKQESFLGIGAKPVKGLEGVELGAWGKSDMRKNNRGEGFFTPVMIEDKRTGEKITEEEFERRKKLAQKGVKATDEEDWRDRRDRNLERSGRDRPNGDDDVNGSRKRDRNERDYDSEKSSRSRRDRERSDKEYDRSRSQRDRSRSKDQKRRTNRNDYDEDDRDREGRRDRNYGKHRDEERYDSSSSRRSEHRHRDHDGHGDRSQDKDRDRERDRRRDRDDATASRDDRHRSRR